MEGQDAFSTTSDSRTIHEFKCGHPARDQRNKIWATNPTHYSKESADMQWDMNPEAVAGPVLLECLLTLDMYLDQGHSSSCHCKRECFECQKMSPSSSIPGTYAN
eukprot:3177741-Amphidinium_carterae.2